MGTWEESRRRTTSTSVSGHLRRWTLLERLQRRRCKQRLRILADSGGGGGVLCESGAASVTAQPSGKATSSIVCLGDHQPFLRGFLVSLAIRLQFQFDCPHRSSAAYTQTHGSKRGAFRPHPRPPSRESHATLGCGRGGQTRLFGFHAAPTTRTCTPSRPGARGRSAEGEARRAGVAADC